jgi:hypothetical protein
MGGYTLAMACVAAHWAGRTGSPLDPLQRGAARESVRQRTGLAGCTGSYRFAAATPACGLVCEGKTPTGFGSDPEVLDGLSQRDGGSAVARRWRGSTAVTRTAPQPGPIVSKARQSKEKNGLWPGVGARRRDDAARRLGMGRSPARRRHSHGRGRMGASRCRACTHVKQARPKGPEGRGFYPLTGRARRFGHGGAQVGAHGDGKKTRLTRPAATYERMRPRRRRWLTESPKDLTFFSCSRVHSASGVAKATAARQAGRRGARRKEKEAKGSALASQVGVRAFGGARLCDGVQDFTGAQGCACRRLGHGGGPERRRTARRPKESKGGTKHCARATRTAATSARRRNPA